LGSVDGTECPGAKGPNGAFLTAKHIKVFAKFAMMNIVTEYELNTVKRQSSLKAVFAQNSFN
jgi:hypothetical protein